MKNIAKLLVITVLISLFSFGLSACGGNRITILVTGQEVEQSYGWTFDEHLEFANSDRESGLLILNYENSFTHELPRLYIRTLSQRRQTVSDSRVSVSNIRMSSNPYIRMTSSSLQPIDLDQQIIDETLTLTVRRQSGISVDIRVVRSAVTVESLTLTRTSSQETISVADQFSLKVQPYPLDASFPNSQFIIESITRGNQTITANLSNYAVIHNMGIVANIHTTGNVLVGDQINLVAISEVDEVKSNKFATSVTRRPTESIQMFGQRAIFRGQPQVGGAINAALSPGGTMRFWVNAYPLSATANFENNFSATITGGSAISNLSTTDRNTFELEIDNNLDLIGSQIRFEVSLSDGADELLLRVAVHIVEYDDASILSTIYLAGLPNTNLVHTGRNFEFTVSKFPTRESNVTVELIQTELATLTQISENTFRLNIADDLSALGEQITVRVNYSNQATLFRLKIIAS